MTGTTVELSDVQGIIRRGYGDMHRACFLLLRIRDATATRRWLGDLIDRITDGKEKPPEGRLNIAFTYDGLEWLHLEQELLDGFSREFKEGMTTPHRQRILGDFGRSVPASWEWGGPTNEPVHCVLLLYAPTSKGLAGFCDAQRAAFGEGCSEIRHLGTERLPHRREHFGFRDGIGQPAIRGFESHAGGGDMVAPGEFLLGCRNQSGRYPEGPGEFGRNGSYLVFRQLEQHVREFWEFVDNATRDGDGNLDAAKRTHLAAKMVGRWPSGAPLVRHPDRDPDAAKSEDELPPDEVSDQFGYHALDPHGRRCPLGAHIRRSNPRDALEPGPASSIRNSDLHRILRRGRAYGPPISPSMDPADILASSEGEDGARGLHFLCFQADIGQQFEFVQQNWINSPKFESLFYAAADPIAGAHDPRHPDYTGTFTVQAAPVRRRVTGVPRFVDVKGGLYRTRFPGHTFVLCRLA